MKPILTLSLLLALLPPFARLVAASPAATNATPITAHIAPFSDATAGKAWSGIDAALRDLLMAAVSRDTDVALVDREHLDQVLREQKLTLKDLIDPATAARVGKLLGANRLVTGTVMVPDGQQLLVAAHVLDVDTATVLKTCQAKGRPEDLLDLTIDLGRQVAEALKVPFAPAAVTAIDTTPIASLHFLRGLGYFHAGNAEAAVMEFMTCLDAAPDHPTARYWMGQCYFKMGEFAHARIELDRFAPSASAGPELETTQSLLIECRKRVAESATNGTLKAGGEQ